MKIWKKGKRRRGDQQEQESGPQAIEQENRKRQKKADSEDIWLEIKPFFSNSEKESHEMLRILDRIDTFSFFVVRLKDTVTRIYVKTKKTNLALFDSLLDNAAFEITEEKRFSAPYIAYLKMKKHHYALPFATEARPSMVYRAMESLGSNNKSCIVALTCKHRNESYSIASFVRKNTYRESLLGSRNSSSGYPKRRLSSQRELYVKHAKEKQDRRHFHCRIGIGAADKDTIKTILKVMSDDGLAIVRYSKDKSYDDSKVKKPILFNQRFTVLSDIELFNLIAIPADTRSLKLNFGEVKPFTSGPHAETKENINNGHDGL